ncbi:MAG: hypothetical protein QNJ70_27330 [Xenococcaceae cyanobacterium MO_207.B15]|nr:hypothetical protein [Xenococcaceae cyanobacterium MO_207.B15]
MRITISQLERIIDNAIQAGASRDEVEMLKEELQEMKAGSMHNRVHRGSLSRRQGDHTVSISTYTIDEDEFEDLQPKDFKAAFKE